MTKGSNVEKLWCITTENWLEKSSNEMNKYIKKCKNSCAKYINNTICENYDENNGYYKTKIDKK